MKRNLKMSYTCALAVALAASAAFTGCDNDDDAPVYKVPEAVRESFRSMYGNEKNAEWEVESPYFVAEFNYNGFSTEAWYTSDGSWAMTETDYGMQTTYLPMAVQNSFNQSNYSSYTIDDVSLYEKPVSSFCIIELEGPAANDMSLVYDTDGNLLKAVPGDCFDITPDTDPSMINF